MSIEAIFYLCNFSDNLRILISIVLVFSIVLFIGFCLAGLVHVPEFYKILGDGKYDDNDALVKIKFFKKILLILFLAFLSSSTLKCFVPSSNTIYMIVGSHYLKESNLPEKIKLAIESKLDTIIRENLKNESK